MFVRLAVALSAVLSAGEITGETTPKMTLPTKERWDPFELRGLVIEDFLTTHLPFYMGPRRPTRRTTSTTTAFPPTTMYPHQSVRPTDSVCKDLNPPGFGGTWTNGNLSKKLFDLDLRWLDPDNTGLVILLLPGRFKGIYKGCLVQVRRDGVPVGSMKTHHVNNMTIFSCPPGINNTAYASAPTRVHFLFVSIVWFPPPDYSSEVDYIVHATWIKKPEVYLKMETMVPKKYNPYASEGQEFDRVAAKTDSYDWGIFELTTEKPTVYTIVPEDFSYVKFWETQKKQNSYLYYL